MVQLILIGQEFCKKNFDQSHLVGSIVHIAIQRQDVSQISIPNSQGRDKKTLYSKSEMKVFGKQTNIQICC